MSRKSVWSAEALTDTISDSLGPGSVYLCKPYDRPSHKSHLLDAWQRFNVRFGKGQQLLPSCTAETFCFSPAQTLIGRIDCSRMICMASSQQFTPLSLNTPSKCISDRLKDILPYEHMLMKPREGGWLGWVLMLGDQELIRAARSYGFSPEVSWIRGRGKFVCKSDPQTPTRVQILPRLSNWICAMVMLRWRPFHRVHSKAAKLIVRAVT